MTAPLLFPSAMPLPAEGADVAYTPARVARALVEAIRPEIYGATCWEPYVGAASFVDALCDAGAGLVYGTDVDPNAPGLRHPGIYAGCVGDVARGWPFGPATRPDWIVTNPPFSVLFGDERGEGGHLRVLLDTARVGVALLLVGQCLAPAKRDWVWNEAIPDWRLDIRERIAFEGPGRDGKSTDMREYAWFVWRKRAGSWMGRGQMGRVSTETGRVWMGVNCG